MTAATDTMPALPEPDGVIIVGTQALRAFTADTTQSYGRKCAEQAASIPVMPPDVLDAVRYLECASVRDIGGRQILLLIDWLRSQNLIKE